MFLRSIYLLPIIIGRYSAVDIILPDSMVQDHVELAADVKNYFQASSVFNTYHDSRVGLKSLEANYKLSRRFSDKGVFSQSLKLGMIPTYVSYYKDRTSRPLYIVTLRTLMDFNDFAKLANNFTMSLNLWLIFFYNSPEILEICEQPDRNWLNVAFDTKILIKCENDPILREWYSLHKHEVKVNDVVKWQRGEGLIPVNKRSIWLRRSTLEGITLKIATVKESFAVTEYERNHGTLFGLFGSVLRELADAINFSAALVATENMYGNYLEEYHNWTGVIGRLVEGDIDIGVAEFGRSNHRLEVVDFTVPLLLTRRSLYFRQPDMSAINWSTYVEVFDNRIWVANGLIICLFSLVLTLNLSRIIKKHDPSLASYNYFDIWAIYCQQGLPDLPSSISLRIVIVSLTISSVVIYASYAATLTSFLAAYTPSLPFTTEQEFLYDTSYNLSVLRGSVYHDVFKRPTNPTIALMKDRLNKDDKLPYNIDEAIDQICNENVVLCTNDMFIEKVNVKLPCSLVAVDTGRLDSASFTLTKKSPYAGILNYYIEHFRAHGLIRVLKSRHLRKMTPIDSKYYPVGFMGVVPILTIFLCGAILAAILFFGENVHNYLNTNSRKKRKLLCNNLYKSQNSY